MHDYLLYIQSIVERIKEEGRDAKISLNDNKNAKDKDYYAGCTLVYNRVISIMQLEAELMGIPLSELLLDDIDPDNDLL